jgi:hypothetical protein
MFGLNYFDAYYNKFTIVMLSISCLFDLLWLFIKLDVINNTNLEILQYRTIFSVLTSFETVAYYQRIGDYNS